MSATGVTTDGGSGTEPADTRRFKWWKSAPRQVPQVLRLATPALALSVVVLTPFLGKAFTIDDSIFLAQARHALSDPLHPSAFDMAWPDVPSRVSRWPHGPLMAWLLMPAVAMGGDERAAHLVSLLSLGVAVLGTVSLALRLGGKPRTARWVGILVVAMPAVLGMAGTVMPDVLALALGVTGLDRLVAWRDDHRWGSGVAAAVLLGLAPMARPHAALLLAICALLLREKAGPDEGRSHWGDWAPLVGAAAVWSLVALTTRDPEPGGANIVAAAVGFSTTSALAANLLGYFIHWALAMLFVVPWAVLRWRAIARRWWVVAGSTMVAMALLRLSHPSSPRYAFAPVVGLSVAVIVDVFAEGSAWRDRRRMALGVWLLLPLAAVVYVHLPAKYLVLSAPAAAMLLAELAETRDRAGRRVLGVGALLGIFLGVLILRADAEFAEVGRRAASTLIAPRVQAGQRVWFVGHWGFQWYAEQAGARFLQSPDALKPGDFIALARNSTAPTLSTWALQSMVLAGTVEEARPGGRILNQESGAGFYGSGWGYLPWAWGDGLVDAVDLWLVAPWFPGGPPR